MAINNIERTFCGLDVVVSVRARGTFMLGIFMLKLIFYVLKSFVLFRLRVLRLYCCNHVIGMFCHWSVWRRTFGNQPLHPLHPTLYYERDNKNVTTTNSYESMWPINEHTPHIVHNTST